MTAKMDESRSANVNSFDESIESTDKIDGCNISVMAASQHQNLDD